MIIFLLVPFIQPPHKIRQKIVVLNLSEVNCKSLCRLLSVTQVTWSTVNYIHTKVSSSFATANITRKWYLQTRNWRSLILTKFWRFFGWICSSHIWKIVFSLGKLSLKTIVTYYVRMATVVVKIVRIMSTWNTIRETALKFFSGTVEKLY